eukprot:15478300-Alexandrium_andersonii.AAC.1
MARSLAPIAPAREVLILRAEFRVGPGTKGSVVARRAKQWTWTTLAPVQFARPGISPILPA